MGVMTAHMPQAARSMRSVAACVTGKKSEHLTGPFLLGLPIRSSSAKQGVIQINIFSLFPCRRLTATMTVIYFASATAQLCTVRAHESQAYFPATSHAQTRTPPPPHCPCIYGTQLIIRKLFSLLLLSRNGQSLITMLSTAAVPSLHDECKHCF